ncbi:N-formylglutamate amidohydrolase [Zhouia sp. PK063]|uniref:N-formylglutamate amidohydrolase n=1 Tax=Zhouia sp. PK063 TaxID=3373602 RepID=UPI00379DD430
MKWVFTCEHGGNKIPTDYQYLFKNKQELLNTHRGFDIGALQVFNAVTHLSDFYKSETNSRLFIELNRSLHHPNLFSSITKPLSKTEKQQIIAQHYKPYRNAVYQQIKNYIQQNETVLHISFHSFTPVLNGNLRNADVGILYDASRNEEKVFANAFKKTLKTTNTTLKIRFNYPYLGKADGFTTFLRSKFTTKYMGIELEVNQHFFDSATQANQLISTIQQALSSFKNDA